MKLWWTALVGIASPCIVAVAMAQALPHITSGSLQRLDNFPSRYVDARQIDVWLPEGYGPGKRYNVLYMHDGQMLYDPDKTWNKQAWNVASTVSKLIAEGRIAETIVVGIWNNGKHRYAEYFPERSLPYASAAVRRDYVKRAQLGKSRADNYLRFIVKELKPAIDRRFQTRPEREHTFVMGSSMGGLISLYAMSEYPQVFGGAACLSTHWVGRPTAWGTPEQLQNAGLPLAAFRYLQKRLPDPQSHRLYMDRGTIALEAQYAVHQAFFDVMARERGYTEANYMSRIFDGASHDERSWAERLDTPLLFLLGSR